MKKLLSTFSFSLAVFGIHLGVMFSFLETQNLSFLLGIHGFLLLFLLTSNLVLQKVKSIDPKKVGMAFLAVTVFKMLAAIIFIFLVKKYSDFDKNVIVFNFFVAFFTYLTFEVLAAIKELK